MSTIEEQWVPVNNCDGYLISNFGRMISNRNNKKNCLLRPIVMNTGYHRVVIYTTGTKFARCFIHRLVAIHFIPNPEKKPFVLHRDNDPSNNHVSNLRWGTQSENIQQASDDGLFKRMGRPKLHESDIPIIVDAIMAGYKNSQIAKYFNVNQRSIWCIKNGVTWTSITR